MSKHRQRKQRIQRRTQPGSAPGIISVDEHAAPPSVTAISYDSADLEVVLDADLQHVTDLRGKRQGLWVHVKGLGNGDVIRELGKLFALHPLALEDVVNEHQQVKSEDYREYLFIVTRILDAAPNSNTQQISLFLGAGFVLTFEEHSSELLDLIQHRLADAQSYIRTRGCDFLTYAILDTVVDLYFPQLVRFGDQLDDLEDRITDHPPREIVHELHDVRMALRIARRIVWQQRDMVNVLLRDPHPLIGDETRTFLRDCHDHTIQLVELLELDHETCTDLRDVYLSAVSNRMNEIMMVLTIFATIFMPLSFIASLYGMNFNPNASPLNMPELNWFFGYPFALGLMVGVLIAMLLFFRHRGWIWQSRGTDADRTKDV